MLKYSLVPSLPAKSFDEVASLLNALRGEVSGVQIDIVDGIFAPFISWPFTEQNGIAPLRKLGAYSDFEIEIDCMCMRPEAYLDVFTELGIKRVIIHAGSTEAYETCITHAREHGYRIGLGIMNSTSQEFCDTYIPQFDFVQVMGIENIGVQGQPFDARTLETVERLRKAYPLLEIAVDGAVNEGTIPLLLKAGATRFAPGSAIAKSDNPLASYKQLSHMVGL